jgi:NTP pyrophosphatase (non-canonical NTP hydrolase)
MDLNPLSEHVYQVIQSKGHHDVKISPLEALTFRQLNHLHIEKVEAFSQYRRLQISNGDVLPKMIEELADVMIVMLDLCGIQRVDLSDVPIESYAAGIESILWEDLDVAIGLLEDTYRKQSYLNQVFVEDIFIFASRLMRRHGSNPIEEVQKKMKTNGNRPARYGLSEGK